MPAVISPQVSGWPAGRAGRSVASRGGAGGAPTAERLRTPSRRRRCTPRPRPASRWHCGWAWGCPGRGGARAARRAGPAQMRPAARPARRAARPAGPSARPRRWSPSPARALRAPRCIRQPHAGPFARRAARQRRPPGCHAAHPAPAGMRERGVGARTGHVGQRLQALGGRRAAVRHRAPEHLALQVAVPARGQPAPCVEPGPHAWTQLREQRRFTRAGGLSALARAHQ